MSTTIEVFAHHWAFAIYLIGALGLCSLMLLGAYYLGGTPIPKQNATK